MNLYPYILQEVSVLFEFIFGHLRYLVTDVPPQPNSPSIFVFYLFPQSNWVNICINLIISLLLLIYNKMSEIVFSVVVFHVWDVTLSHLAYTKKSISLDKLESSSTGSSFPAVLFKPVPLTVVSLDCK